MFSCNWAFIYVPNGAKINTFVANYIYYKFTDLERQNHSVITLYLQRNERQYVRLFWKQFNILNVFLQLSIYLRTKWRQNIHICSKLYLLLVYRFVTSKSLSYNFVFAEKCTTIRKTVMKTVKSFECFLAVEHLFTYQMTPKYTHL